MQDRKLDTNLEAFALHETDGGLNINGNNENRKDEQISKAFYVSEFQLNSNSSDLGI